MNIEPLLTKFRDPKMNYFRNEVERLDVKRKKFEKKYAQNFDRLRFHYLSDRYFALKRSHVRKVNRNKQLKLFVLMFLAQILILLPILGKSENPFIGLMLLGIVLSAKIVSYAMTHTRSLKYSYLLKVFYNTQIEVKKSLIKNLENEKRLVTQIIENEKKVFFSLNSLENTYRKKNTVERKNQMKEFRGFTSMMEEYQSIIQHELDFIHDFKEVSTKKLRIIGPLNRDRLHH